MRRCWIFSVLLAASLITGPAQAESTKPNPNIVSWAKGTFEYRKISTKEVNGSEEFRLTVHPDGSRTVQTTNRLENFGARRDIVMRVAENFKPMEVFASYWSGGEWRGSGLFTLKGQTMQAFVNTPLGTIEQTIEVPEAFSFVPHPLSTNAFHHWAYDHAKAGRQIVTLYDMPPRAPASAALIGTMNEIVIEYKGRTMIETEAGSFETDFYIYGDDFEMYVTPEHSMLIKGVWNAADAEYVLVELEEGS